MAKAAVEITDSRSNRVPSADAWHSFRAEMDRLFDQVTEGFGRPVTGVTGIVPAFVVIDEDAAFKLNAMLPGMSEKDVSISVSGDTLIIKGENQQEGEAKTDEVTERRNGMFTRSFSLPEGVDRDKISARIVDGMLTVTLPKADIALTRQITLEDTRGVVAAAEMMTGRPPEEAIDDAINGLLDVAQRAAEAAVRRGDEIDAILTEIRALRVGPVS